MGKSKIYVIGNSHMDPIWVWRLREGRAAWLNTCRSVVKMMKKYPFLKFSRSSSVCYRWIEESDPALFREIKKLVELGRWELVGGWVEQSDTIITPGESLIRQAEHGKRYFMDKFGRDVNVAYSVDSFGQNLGLPKILKATGFDYYAWMRPQEHEKSMPDLFRWQCDDNVGDIVSFRILNAYCTIPLWKKIEEFEQWFDKSTGFQKQPHQTFFFGIGDHGGGIYEHQLKWLLQLGEKHELVFSTLADYFKVIEKLKLPVLTGEHTHHAPGCYSAVGDVKQWMSDCEKNLYKAEKIVLQTRPQDKKTLQNLDNAWEELLFNYFHDVYPGTSTRASYQNEVRDLCGMVNKTAVDVIETNLSRLSAQVDTSFLEQGGIMLWNSQPQAVTGVAKFDTFNDPNCLGKIFNCLRTKDGREVPLQWIRAATSYGPNSAWGRAVVVDELPPSGLNVYAYGYTDKKYPDLGFAKQRAWLKKLELAVLSDPFDTWAHGARGFGETVGTVKFGQAEELENGPAVSRLRVRAEWRGSNIQLDLFQYRNLDEVEAVFSGMWLQKDEDLKLVLKNACASVLSGQSLAVLERPLDDCEQPFIDFAVGVKNGKAAGFLTHSLHGYDVSDKNLRLTLLRPVVYAEHAPNPPHHDEGYADVGPFERTVWLYEGSTEPAIVGAAARARLWTAEHWECTAAANGRKTVYGEWSVEPASLHVSAQRVNAEGEAEFRVYNPAGKAVSAKIRCNGQVVATKRCQGSAITLIAVNQK